MSADLIEDAINCLRGEGWDNDADAVAGLAAEIELLRADNEFLHKFVDAPGSILEAALNEVKQLLAAIAEQQAAFGDAIETASKTLATKDVLNNDLMANCNQLRDRCWKAEGELARWQQVAIDERASRIQDARSGDFIDNFGNHGFQVVGIEKCRERAAEELQLQVAPGSSYLSRLEVEYLRLVENNIVDHGLIIGRKDSKNAKELAQATLNKIREGK